jgi:Rod binding domain-containing protein
MLRRPRQEATMDIPAISPRPAAEPRAAVAPDKADRDSDADRDARTAAEAFESAFLAEMLKHTGVNRNPDGWGGGAGEDAFASFLTGEYARLIAERGGVGLAEQIFNAIKSKDPAA